MYYCRQLCITHIIKHPGEATRSNRPSDFAVAVAAVLGAPELFGWRKAGIVRSLVIWFCLAELLGKEDIGQKNKLALQDGVSTILSWPQTRLGRALGGLQSHRGACRSSKKPLKGWSFRKLKCRVLRVCMGCLGSKTLESFWNHGHRCRLPPQGSQ